MITLNKENIKELVEVRGFTSDKKESVLNCVLLKLDGVNKKIEMMATDNYMAIKKVIQLDDLQDFESCNILIENKIIDLIKKEKRIIISESNNTILLNNSVGVYPFVLSKFNNNYPEVESVFNRNIEEDKKAVVSLGVEELTKMMKALKNNFGIQIVFENGTCKPCIIKEDNKKDTSIIFCPLRIEK